MSDLNDPRVFFAAERTLLAWNRTSLTLMAFGFVVERFQLFLHLFAPGGRTASGPDASFWVGLAFIVLGTTVAVLATVQFRRLVATLKPVEIPPGYWVNVGVYTNLILAALGAGLVVYLLRGGY